MIQKLRLKNVKEADIIAVTNDILLQTRRVERERQRRARAKAAARERSADQDRDEEDQPKND